MKTSMRKRRRAHVYKLAAYSSWWLKCEAKWDADREESPGYRAYMGEDGWLHYY